MKKNAILLNILKWQDSAHCFVNKTEIISKIKIFIFLICTEARELHNDLSVFLEGPKKVRFAGTSHTLFSNFFSGIAMIRIKSYLTIFNFTIYQNENHAPPAKGINGTANQRAKYYFPGGGWKQSPLVLGWY